MQVLNIDSKLKNGFSLICGFLKVKQKSVGYEGKLGMRLILADITLVSEFQRRADLPSTTIHPDDCSSLHPHAYNFVHPNDFSFFYPNNRLYLVLIGSGKHLPPMKKNLITVNLRSKGPGRKEIRL